MLGSERYCHALVMGWFSFPGYGATAGDLLTAELVEAWLVEAGIKTDCALSAPFTGGVDWESVDPKKYTHLVFVCGPFGDDWLTQKIFDKFRSCKKVGMHLSMLRRLDE